jgi:mevalonate kinase
MTPLEALQATLAGEHAAVYVYGVLGAQSSESEQPTLFTNLQTAYQLHRRRRDQLTVMIEHRGIDPVPSAVSYALPNAAATSAELTDAALQVESRISTTYGQLVGSSSGSDRRWGIAALDDCAVRQLTFRGTPEMFPGMES